MSIEVFTAVQSSVFCSGLWRHVDLYVGTNISEEHIISFFRADGGSMLLQTLISA
jgi:hypothetical protein